MPNRGGKDDNYTGCWAVVWCWRRVWHIYIPGKAFTFSPLQGGIYTHFPADEDKTLDLGRFGEECKRFKAIYEEADSRSLL